MLEWKRILGNKTNLFMFVLLFLLHGVFFFFQCNEEKAVTLTGVELTEYIDGYGDYVKSVHENAEIMKETPLFSTADSFVLRNLDKTDEDFRALDDVVPVVGENRGIMTVLNFNLSNFILLFFGVYFVLSFLVERQKGLYLLVRSTKNGRFMLSLQRIGVLCGGLFAAALLLYGSVFVIASCVFPGCDYLRPAQSVPELGEVTIQCSILGYIVLFLIRKVFGCILASLLLYFCMSIFKTSLCVVAFCLLFVGEYILSTFLISTGKWSAFKYFNVYTYVFCGTEYANYYNVNLFGHPVNITVGADTAVFFMLLVVAIGCLIRYAVQYPGSAHRSFALLERVKAFCSRHKPSLSLTGWELKKVFISQKGLLVFFALFLLAFSASTESNYRNFRSRYVSHWYEEFTGEVNEELIIRITDKRTSMEDKVKRLEASIAVQEQTVMEYMMKGWETEYIQGLIKNMRNTIAEYREEIKGISVVLEHAKKSLEISERLQMPLTLFDTNGYELLFKSDKQTILRNYLYSLLMIVFIISGVMAFEKMSHTEMLLHSLYRGRGAVAVRKILIMFGVCVVGTLSIHLIQYVQIGKAFPFINQHALVQSVFCMQEFPVPISLRQYLFFLYGFRVFESVLFGGTVMLLGKRFHRVTTMMLGMFLLIIPMALVAMRL